LRLRFCRFKRDPGNAVDAVIYRDLPFTFPWQTHALLAETPLTKIPGSGVAEPSAQYIVCRPEGSGAGSASTACFVIFRIGIYSLLLQISI
jgi:hypothetical protein